MHGSCFLSPKLNDVETYEHFRKKYASFISFRQHSLGSKMMRELTKIDFVHVEQVKHYWKGRETEWASSILVGSELLIAIIYSPKLLKHIDDNLIIMMKKKTDKHKILSDKRIAIDWISNIFYQSHSKYIDS